MQSAEARPALEQLYRRDYGLVRWVLRAAGATEASLDDLVHDTFVAIHRRLPDRDPSVPIRQWIAGIARNVAFSHRRAAARSQRRLQMLAEPEAPEQPDDAFARRQAWRSLSAFLDELSVPQREVFVMVDVVGMRVARLAEITGEPANTLHSRLRAARTEFGRRFDGQSRSRSVALREAKAGGAPDRAQRRRTWGLVVASVGGPQQLLPASALVGAAARTGWWAAWTTKLALASVVVGSIGAASVLPPVPTRSLDLAGSVVAVGTKRSSSDAPPTVSVAARVDTPEASPPTRRIEPTVDAPAVTRTNGRRARGSSPATPLPAADPIAAELAALEQARRLLAAGKPVRALGVLDGLEGGFSVLGREHRRVEREAACAAGNSSRAQAASVALVKIGAQSPEDPICPDR